MQLARVGVLRLALGALGVVSVVCRFLTASSGPWDVILGQVVPALVVMLAWVLPFDALMARVMMGARPAEQRGRYADIIKFDLALLLALILFWGPFFFTVLNR